jgi:hypothetical protein
MHYDASLLRHGIAFGTEWAPCQGQQCFGKCGTRLFAVYDTIVVLLHVHIMYTCVKPPAVAALFQMYVFGGWTAAVELLCIAYDVSYTYTAALETCSFWQATTVL